jgi:tetratricopeptide (TPR) repeat protein
MLADECTMLNRFDKAFELYQYVIDHKPEDKSAKQSEMEIAQANVLSLIESGDDAAANQALDSLIADFNDNPALPIAILEIGEKYYYKAFWCEKKRRAAEAKENFINAIAIWERIITDLSPSTATPEAYLLSAVCYRRLGEHEQALEYYKKIVSDWPDYEYAWTAQAQIGRTCEYLRNVGVIPKSEADIIIRAAYEAVLEKYPHCPAAPAARNRLKSNRYQHQGRDALGLLKPPPPPPNKGEER